MLLYEVLLCAGMAQGQGPRGGTGCHAVGWLLKGAHSSLQETGVWLPSIIDGMCIKITQCQNGVMVGTSPAYVQCPHNPMLLQMEKGGGLGRWPCAAALSYRGDMSQSIPDLHCGILPLQYWVQSLT